MKGFVDPPGTNDPHESMSYCPDCTRFYWNGLGHRCDARMRWPSILAGLLLTSLGALITLTVAWLATR